MPTTTSTTSTNQQSPTLPAMTPLQLLDYQAANNIKTANVNPSQFTNPTMPSTTPTGTTQAPAVISSTAANQKANDIQTAMTAKNTAQQQQSVNNQQVAQQQQDQQQQQQEQTLQNQQTLADKQAEAALTAAASGAPGPTNNPSNVQIPTGIDINTGVGQIQFYQQNPQQFQQWAQDQGWTQEQVSNFQYQATIYQQNVDASNIKSSLAQFQNGTYPLTADQQAQLDATKQQFDSLIATQKLVNQSYENGTRILGITTGRQEYAPYDAMGEVQAAINTGLQKVADLQSKEASTLATMKQGFEDSNFKMVTEANNELIAIDKEITQNFKDLHDQVVSANQKAYDNARQTAMDDWTKYVNQKDLDLKDATQKLDQMKFTEQQKMDAEKILDDKIKNGIAEADLKLKQAEFNATYGSFTDANGNTIQNFSPSNIPGVKQSVKGVYYFDPTQFSDKKQATAAENIARKAGITILSDKTDVEAMTNLTGAIQNLQTLQDMFQKLAPSDFPLAKDVEKLGNAASFLSSRTGLYTTDRRAEIDAYNSNRDQLFKQIFALAGGHPRINSQELEAAANALPKLTVLNMDTLKQGNDKLQLTRKYLYNAVQAEVPNSNLPKSGDIIYNTTDDLLKAHPDRAPQAADLAKQGYSDDDIRAILNY